MQRCLECLSRRLYYLQQLRAVPGALRGLKDAIQTKIVWHCLFLHILRDRTDLVITVFAPQIRTLPFVCMVANLEIKIRSKCVRSSGSSQGLGNERGKDSGGEVGESPVVPPAGTAAHPGVMGSATSHIRSQQTEQAPGEHRAPDLHVASCSPPASLPAAGPAPQGQVLWSWG